MLLQYIEKTLNRYLALDPESKRRMAPLTGKRVALKLLGTGFVCELLFDAAAQIRLCLPAADDTPPDLTIEGTPLALLRLQCAEGHINFVAAGVTVTGDMELAQDVQQLFRGMEIDWEECLAVGMGDVPARGLFNVLRQIKTTARYMQAHLTRQLSDYMHEEINLVPTRAALQDFYHEVDTLRMRVDRVQARCRQLTGES